MQMLPGPLALLQASPLAHGLMHCWQVLPPTGVIHPGWLHWHVYRPHTPPCADRHLFSELPRVKQGSAVAHVSSHLVQALRSGVDTKPSPEH